MKIPDTACLAVLCLLPLCAHSEVSVETYCFDTQEKKPIRFELRTYYDSAAQWSGAFVKYAQSKQAIALVYSHSESEELAEGRPYQVTRTWLEVADSKVSGEYEMMSQGAMVYSMTYTNRASGKTYSFQRELNVDSSEEKGCQWSTL